MSCKTCGHEYMFHMGGTSTQAICLHITHAQSKNHRDVNCTCKRYEK